MIYLIAGLVLFLGVHSVRIFADSWRTNTIAKVGEKAFKGAYSLVSLAGFVLLIWGFGVARETPVIVWNPPVAMRHIAGLLTLLAFVFLAAAHGPANGIRARVHHPMVVAVKTWALAHLVANGTLAHIVLFGAFLVWAVLDFVAARKRDRANNIKYPAGKGSATLVVIGLGIVYWAAFAFWLHGLLIGVKPMG